jgi:transposase
MNRTTIHKWLDRAKGKGAGLRKLKASKGTGRPRKLDAKQERQVFRWVNGKNPNQYGFDFGLWTRSIVCTLIEEKFGIRLSLASVGALLARLNLTAQKPLERAYQRDPEAIALWQRETYPAIAKQAKAQKAEIYFGTSPASVLMRCTERHGPCVAKRLWFTDLASARASARRPPSIPRVLFGLQPIKVVSRENCSWTCCAS